MARQKIQVKVSAASGEGMKEEAEGALERFLALCTRKNCALSYFSSRAYDEWVLRSAFAAVCQNPLKPEMADAHRFLDGAGCWIAAEAEEFLQFARQKPLSTVAPFLWDNLEAQVQEKRTQHKSLKRQKALHMERENELATIDTSFDEYWMTEALTDAKMALLSGEVPVGAVLVSGGKLLARGRNAVLSDKDPTAHAEIIAIRNAAKRSGTERLENCTLYVTLEPCAMCSGAIRHARIPRVVYGAKAGEESPVCGSCGLLEAGDEKGDLVVTSGVLAEECSALLKTFFAAKRAKAASES